MSGNKPSAKDVVGSALTAGFSSTGRELAKKSNIYETSSEKKEESSARDAEALSLQQAEDAKTARLEADRKKRMSIFQTGMVGGEEVGAVAPRGTIFGN